MAIDHAGAADLLERMAAARVTFDGDAWTNLFTEDAVSQGDPSEPSLVGHNALRADLLGAAEAQEQVEFTWERHWVVPPTILAPWRMSYVDRHSRVRVSFAGFATLEIGRDGRIVRARWWYFRRDTPVTG